MTIQANQGFGVSIFGATSAGGGGSTSPGGSSGQLQYNASGSFGGMAGTSWDDTNRALTLTGATVTTSQPVLNLSQTWNAGAVTFTGLKFNATDTASASGSLLLDLQVGGVSVSNITKAGNISASGSTAAACAFAVTGTAGTGLFFANSSNMGVSFGGAGYSGFSTSALSFVSSYQLAWRSGNISSGIDTILTRAAAATFQLGAADAAAPVAQTLQVQSVVAGTSNTAGANWTLKGSAGTGTGAGGSIIFQFAPAGSSGTAQNAYQNAFLITQQNAGNTEARVINAGSSSALLTVAATSNTNSAVLIKHSTATDGSGGTTFGYLGRVNSNLGVFDGGGNLIIGAPSGTSDSVSIWGTDCRLARDAANTLALRNGTSNQTFNLYQTYTDASNYSRLRITYGGVTSAFSISTEAAGTGTTQDLILISNKTLIFNTNSGYRWQIDTSGHFLAWADNTYDIGAFNGSRPRYGYFATGVAIYGSSAGVAMLQGGDGILRLLNYNNNDFNRIQFGGTTSSFPALKRSSATLQVRLADDSAFAQLTASSLLAAGSTGVVGYSTGAGGAVTQATSRTTGVTLNKGCGQITLVSAAGTTSWQSFTVSNTTVAATDTIIVNQDSGTDLYQIFVTNVAANSFQITFATTGGTTTEQPVFSFAVIKAVAA